MQINIFVSSYPILIFLLIIFNCEPKTKVVTADERYSHASFRSTNKDVIIFKNTDIAESRGFLSQINNPGVAIHYRRNQSHPGYDFVQRICNSESGSRLTGDTQKSHAELQFLMYPETEQDLHILLESLDALFKAKLDGSCRDKRAPQQRFFIYYAPKANRSDFTSSQEYCSELINASYFIPQNEHVYLLISVNLEENQVDKDEVEDLQITFAFELYTISDNLICEDIHLYEDLKEMNQNNYLFDDTSHFVGMASRRSNLRGMELRVLAEKNDNFKGMIDVDTVNGTVVFKSGYSLRYLLDLQFMLNFRVTGVLGNGWTENRSHISGIAAQFIEKQADFCISLSGIYENHGAYFHPLPALSRSEVYAFFHQQVVSSTGNIMFMPFSSGVWLAIGTFQVTILVSSALFCWKVKNLNTETPLDVFMSIIGSFFLQGWSKMAVKQLRIRVLLLISFLTNTLLYTFYTAAFVAAISAPVTLIRTYKDLLRHKYLPFTDPSFQPYVFDLPSRKHEKLDLKERSKKLFQGNEDMLQKVLPDNSKYAFLIDLDGFYSIGLHHNISETQLCKISFIRRRGGIGVSNSMFLRKNVPYKELFDHRIALMTERGLVERYNAEYEDKVVLRCLDKEREGTSELTLQFNQCYPAFLFLIFGISAALVAVIVERLYTSNVLPIKTYRYNY